MQLYCECNEEWADAARNGAIVDFSAGQCVICGSLHWYYPVDISVTATTGKKTYKEKLKEVYEAIRKKHDVYGKKQHEEMMKREKERL